MGGDEPDPCCPSQTQWQHDGPDEGYCADGEPDGDPENLAAGGQPRELAFLNFSSCWTSMIWG